MMFTMFYLVIFSSLVVNINCLTTEELQQFGNDGSQGGTVQTTSFVTYDRIQSNGLPDHETQRVNPHSATAQNYDFTFPKEPSIGCTPGCLPGGVIAITKTGVAIFNALDAQGENAVEGPGAESFDTCQGHSDPNGRYHYHKIPDVCGLYTGATDEFIGVALDGFPIYGPKVSDKVDLLTADDLDECNGRFVDGKYRYHVTNDFPYFLGCFKGADAGDNLNRISYDCGEDGTDAQEYGYVCGCTRGPSRVVPATVCDGGTTTTVPITTPTEDPCVALDGFPIYGPKVSDKVDLLTADDLDECNGRFVDGKYRYHVTNDFPYFLGCFKGADAGDNLNRISYDCGEDGTDAQEYGYVCGCTRGPSRVVPATVCDGGTTTTVPITTPTEDPCNRWTWRFLVWLCRLG